MWGYSILYLKSQNDPMWENACQFGCTYYYKHYRYSLYFIWHIVVIRV